MEFIRGHLEPVNNRKTSFALVAVYVYTTWKERKADRPPATNEIERLWASIFKP
jgi:hypothetical protein